MTAEYYLKRQGRLLRNHRRMMAIGRPMLAERFGPAFAEQAVCQSTEVFQALLAELPYIGGDENPLTDTLVQVTSVLALYRVLQEHMSAAEVGELAHRMTEAWIARTPRWLRHLAGRYYLSRMMQRRKRRQAALSQQRRHPEDFVFKYVAGDGAAFDWGIDYLECAIVKFFQEQGAAALTPYMCRLDFLMFPALGISLQRTGTRAQGCSHCDFRFSWGGAEAKAAARGLIADLPIAPSPSPDEELHRL